MSEKLIIKNWEKFQHYKGKDGPPPWVKLYSEVINSEDWIFLNDAGKLLMLSLMILGCRYNGSIPSDTKFLKKVLHLKKEPDLLPLITCGFLVPDPENLDSVYNQSRPTLDQIRSEEIRSEDNSEGKLPADIEEDAWEVLRHLNQITGRSWRRKKASLKMIMDRMNQGATIEECKSVIDAKWKEWKFDEKMVKFVQPSTLFGKKNFAKYLAQIEAGPALVGSGTVIDTFEPEPEISDEDRAQTEAFLDSLKPEGD